MLLERHLHLLLSPGDVAALEGLDADHFRRRFPGEHVALVSIAEADAARATDWFSEVRVLDLTFVQRVAYHPVLGDDIAFHHFQAVLAPLTGEGWGRIFNWSGSPLATALVPLLRGNPVGRQARGAGEICAEPPLKAALLLERWQLLHPVLTGWLRAKTVGQVPWETIERDLVPVAQAKGGKHAHPLKSLVVVVPVGAVALAQREWLEQLFTVVEAPADSATAWLADMVVGTTAAPAHPWSNNISTEALDPEALSARLGVLVPRALAKWTALAVLFDYLGNPRLSLAAEKILGRFDHDALHQFLASEILALKAFTKPLLEGMRRPAPDAGAALENFWGAHAGSVAFACAIELSLRPSVVPLLTGDGDWAAVRSRMRSLNQFYERLHRTSALELPKTDLALTL
jgi:hypothetical protein